MNYVSPKMEMIEIENEDVILASADEIKPGTSGGLGGGNESGFAPTPTSNDDTAATFGLR